MLPLSGILVLFWKFPLVYSLQKAWKDLVPSFPLLSRSVLARSLRDTRLRCTTISPCPVCVEVWVGAQALGVFAHVDDDSTFQFGGQQLLCKRLGQIVFLGCGVMPSRSSGAFLVRRRWSENLGGASCSLHLCYNTNLRPACLTAVASSQFGGAATQCWALPCAIHLAELCPHSHKITPPSSCQQCSLCNAFCPLVQHSHHQLWLTLLMSASVVHLPAHPSCLLMLLRL